jgi:signal transduction histidine kinase
VKTLNVGHNFYPRNEFDNFLKQQSYFLKPYLENEQCFYHDGSYCFEKNAGSLTQLFKQSSIIIFIFSIIVLLLVAIILISKIKQQAFDEERKKHALRVLTHELRTPITNLLLQVEAVNKQSDIMPPKILEEFLKMEGEVYRLKRLAEKSTSYLQTNDKKSLMAINLIQVPSINALISDIVKDYSMKGVSFTKTEVDHSVILDAYWFSICLKNLIENSITHGSAPVLVQLISSSNNLSVTVIDQGITEFKMLDQMMNGKNKNTNSNSNSSGLGLGLVIVEIIMGEMNGRLKFTSNPTTFSLVLEVKK